MNPVELGDGIQDTNTVPGRKQRMFYAVHDNGARVVTDATNRTIIIDKTAKTGAFSAVVTDNSALISLIGAAAVTALLAANDTDAQMRVVGVHGSIDCDTSKCNGKDLFPREEDWCNAAGTQKGKIMVVCSPPYNVVNV